MKLRVRNKVYVLHTVIFLQLNLDVEYELKHYQVYVTLYNFIYSIYELIYKIAFSNIERILLKQIYLVLNTLYPK